MRRDYKAAAGAAVFIGDFLPARDEVFDAAEEVADALTKLHAAVTEARDAEQADDAVDELLDALRGKPVGPARFVEVKG